MPWEKYSLHEKCRGILKSKFSLIVHDSEEQDNLSNIPTLTFLHYPTEKHNCLTFVVAGIKDKNHSGNQNFILVIGKKIIKEMFKKTQNNNKTTDFFLPPVLFSS